MIIQLRIGTLKTLYCVKKSTIVSLILIVKSYIRRRIGTRCLGPGLFSRDKFLLCRGGGGVGDAAITSSPANLGAIVYK